MIGIYRVTNRINGKSYIGQSKNIESRLKYHQTANRESNLAIRNDLIKYGSENFLYEVLEECDVTCLDEREGYYIRTLKPEYNTKGFTEHGIHYNDESTRAKIRSSAKLWWKNLPSETKEKITRNNLTGRKKGYHLTSEQKDRLRKANLGKKQSTETKEKRKETMRKLKDSGAYVQTNAGHRKPIVCITDQRTFESVKAAGEWYGISSSKISSVLKGRQKTTNNLAFEYLEV